ncbi:MAG: vitamin K epoxide reductase family protein [Planctomycetota bacterium]
MNAELRSTPRQIALLIAFAGCLEGVALNAVSLLTGVLMGSVPAEGSVQRTPWGALLGVPVTAWALLVYLLMLLSLTRRHTPGFQSIAGVLGWVLLFTPAWFVSVQVLVLERVCPFCLAAHLAGIAAGVGAIAVCKTSRSAPAMALILVFGMAIVQSFGSLGA